MVSALEDLESSAQRRLLLLRKYVRTKMCHLVVCEEFERMQQSLLMAAAVQSSCCMHIDVFEQRHCSNALQDVRLYRTCIHLVC
jgi:hypothetical protein